LVAPEQRIASAFFVIHGEYGDVTRYARQRGICRQSIYNERPALRKDLATAQHEKEKLRGAIAAGTAAVLRVVRTVGEVVVLDAEKQGEFAGVSVQAARVTLRDCRELLKVLIPGRALSVAELGRRSNAAAGKKRPKRCCRASH